MKFYFLTFDINVMIDLQTVDIDELQVFYFPCNYAIKFIQFK